jgi:hypothetical protein
MQTHTITGSRSESAIQAGAGLVLALGFGWLAVAPHADAGARVACAVLALLAALIGGWGLAEAIQPPSLALTVEGFTFRRPFLPPREVKWSDVEAVGVARRPFGPSVYYQLKGGQRRHGFFLFTAQPHELAEVMNRALARVRPAAPAPRGGLPTAR